MVCVSLWKGLFGGERSVLMIVLLVAVGPLEEEVVDSGGDSCPPTLFKFGGDKACASENVGTTGAGKIRCCSLLAAFAAAANGE